jgi:hypothetical protein
MEYAGIAYISVKFRQWYRDGMGFTPKEALV